MGLAFASLVRGRLSAKLLWLAAGLVLIWLLDVARVLAIFAAGSLWGDKFALNVEHGGWDKAQSDTALRLMAGLFERKIDLGALRN